MKELRDISEIGESRMGEIPVNQIVSASGMKKGGTSSVHPLKSV